MKQKQKESMRYLKVQEYRKVKRWKIKKGDCKQWQ